MTTNGTIVFSKPGEVTIEDRDRPEPERGEVLLETRRTLISTGTELTVLSGEYPPGSHWDEYGEYPHLPGYSNVAEVIETGPEVDLDVGRRVTTQGNHARYTTADADACRPIPDDVSDREAAFASLAEIVMNGVRRGRVAWGEAVVFYGAGLLGQLGTRLCAAAGAHPVITFDIVGTRLSYLPDRAGVHAIDPRETAPESIVREANHGRLADVVFEVTGNPEAIPAELDTLTGQGRFVLLSSPRGETSFDFHDHCNWPSYEIIGAHETSHPPTATPANPWTNHRNAELFFDYLLAERLDVEPLITHERSFDEAPSLYHMLLEDRTEALGVQLVW